MRQAGYQTKAVKVLPLYSVSDIFKYNNSDVTIRFSSTVILLLLFLLFLAKSLASHVGYLKRLIWHILDNIMGFLHLINKAIMIYWCHRQGEQKKKKSHLMHSSPRLGQKTKTSFFPLWQPHLLSVLCFCGQTCQNFKRPACDVTSFPTDQRAQRNVLRRPRAAHTEKLIERKEWYAGTINIHHFKSLYCQKRQCVCHQSGVSSLLSALCGTSTCPERRFKWPPHARPCQTYQRRIDYFAGRTAAWPHFTSSSWPHNFSGATSS